MSSPSWLGHQSRFDVLPPPECITGHLPSLDMCPLSLDRSIEGSSPPETWLQIYAGSATATTGVDRGASRENPYDDRPCVQWETSAKTAASTVDSLREGGRGAGLAYSDGFRPAHTGRSP